MIQYSVFQIALHKVQLWKILRIPVQVSTYQSKYDPVVFMFCFLFADNFIIYFSFLELHMIEENLQDGHKTSEKTKESFKF